MKITLSCIIAAMVAAGGLAPLTAHAEDEVTIRRTVVTYADLDLAAEADARALLQRIGRASAKVCRRDGEKGISKDALQCRRTAVRQAVRDVKAPVLTALYEGTPTAMALASR